MKRREFVSLLSISAASATLGLNPVQVIAQQQLPSPAAWLRSGPMLGHSELTETSVWLQTTKACRAEIRFWKQGKPNTARLGKAVQTNEENDFIARFKLTRLEFGTVYDYEIYLDGLRVPLTYRTTFQTQKMWRWRIKEEEAVPPFRLAIGSCAYINDQDYDRPGEPYGGNYEIFETIAGQKPDAMLWLGDNFYYREADWLNEQAMRYRYAHGRSLQELQKLLASTHHYAIWDDHDFGPNDSDRAYRLPETSLKIFQDYWSNAAYGTPETPGIFSRFEWNDVEFFLLDNRFYRSPNLSPNDPKKEMFGARQMQWLRDALTSSNASFKIVVGGNQMMNPLTPFEAWGNFAEEQKGLINYIREARINGVLFLSGDRHLTELIKRTEPGLYPLYDFTSSPLTSGPSKPSGEEINNPSRIPGTLVTGVRNFGILEATGIQKNRKLTLRTIDSTGKEWWKYEIHRNDLTCPRT